MGEVKTVLGKFFPDGSFIWDFNKVHGGRLENDLDILNRNVPKTSSSQSQTRSAPIATRRSPTARIFWRLARNTD
jgi:hypothetical protein